MQPLARYLDAAILKPETTQAEMEEAVRACLGLNTYSVCVRPSDIAPARRLCEGADTMVCVVLGFPHGCVLPDSKVDEARRYVEAGVGEIDMVANYGWVKSDRWDDVRDDIAGVAGVAKPAGVPLKVIFETSQLEDGSIAKLVDVCVAAGADFVKTSTGFNGAGAQEEHVRLMLETAAGRIKVKPSGGIRDAASAQRFVDMGAHRLGVNWASCEAICRGGEAASSEGY